MTVRLSRASAGQDGPGVSFGVEVDDGQARSWQNAGEVVGRFGRPLADEERAALDRAVVAARQAVADGAIPTVETWKPEGSTERVSVDDLPTIALDPHEDPPPQLAPLLDALHNVMGDLTGSPVAAIALDVDGSPLRARLRHVGSEPVAVRLGRMEVETVLFGEGDVIVERARSMVDGPAETIETNAGWTFDLGGELGLPAPEKGQFLTVRVDIEADIAGGGVLDGAQLSKVIE
jgi:hypothetical protein